MAAVLKPIEEAIEQEFLLIASKEGHSMTGTELGLGRALHCARTLALTGWSVSVESCDPFIDDAIRYTVSK